MPILGDTESKGPVRPAQSTSFTKVQAPDRGPLRWRAIVRVGQKLDASRGHQPLAWHLVDCVETARADAHCDVGRLLMATDGNPDGHCLVDATCPRCAGLGTPVETG
jgi:hypothetical protein